MKLTKSRLKRIIKEEINKVLESHETTLLKTAAAHSALYANQQLENAATQDELEILESRIEVLEMEQPSE